MERPNILLFFTDQQSLDAIGCYGETPCKTPNIDGLAREGVQFLRNYTICPLCSPARASVLTGKEVHAHGVTTNVHELGCNVSEIPDSPDLLSRRLSNAGYSCGYTGKWHIGNGYPVSRGGLPVSPGTPTTRGFVGQDTPENRGGWQFPDFWEHLTKLGLEEEIPKYKRNFGDTQGELTVVDHPIEGTCEYFLADNTIQLIDDFKKEGKPFFIWHNTWGPHGSYISHRDYYNLYKDITIPEPANFRLNEEDKYLPATYKRTAAKKDWGYFQEQKRRYYALTTQIDAMLGRIVAHLKSEGLYENTVILFTSDHGSHFGYHGGLTDKGFSHYEEIHRTGCIIMDPRKPADSKSARCDSYTSILDIYPTILDFAGVPAPEGLDGFSLRPLMQGEKENLRDHAFVEFYGLGHVNTTMMSIVYDNLKYGWNPTNRDELYDLEKDPLQLVNCIDEPSYEIRLKKIRQKMFEHLKNHRNPLANLFNNSVLIREYS
ncbi:MAG TPA: hypothetical protein DD727_07770 [Clostridiales bacterium]|nr:hypothetical protein [Clostridiales bacterium]